MLVGIVIFICREKRNSNKEFIMTLKSTGNSAEKFG